MPSFRPLQDDPGAANETKLGHLAPEQARVVASFGPATFKVGLVGLQDARAWRLVPERRPTRPQPPADRLALRPECCGDC